MATYCTSADIVENMKGVSFSANSAVTSTALTNMIDQESATIEAHIQAKYALPITDATALLFLKKICIDLVVYRVTKVLQPKEVISAPDGKVEQEISAPSAYRNALGMLRALMNGKAQLPLESKKSINFISSTAVDNDTSTVFKHDEQQW